MTFGNLPSLQHAPPCAQVYLPNEPDSAVSFNAPVTGPAETMPTLLPKQSEALRQFVTAGRLYRQWGEPLGRAVLTVYRQDSRDEVVLRVGDFVALAEAFGQ